MNQCETAQVRHALGVEYDGAGFCGWQRQREGRSVQQCVEQALSKVADHPVKVVCAGRTDTGVHAEQQVIHFDSAAPRSVRSWVLGANVNLPRDISILWGAHVSSEFHARFSAEARSYRYVILNRMSRPALLHQRVCWWHRPLDESAMQRAAQSLEGKHDFTSFRALACQARHPVRTVERIAVRREGEFVYIDITANAFLHHMVRNMAGSLLAVGEGDRPAEWIAQVLAARDRSVCGMTAPAGGLYLCAVRYPSTFQLPQRGRG